MNGRAIMYGVAADEDDGDPVKLRLCNADRSKNDFACTKNAREKGKADDLIKKKTEPIPTMPPTPPGASSKPRGCSQTQFEGCALRS